MLVDQSGLVATHQSRQAAQVSIVKRTVRTDRQSHAVQRERIIGADRCEVTMRRTAGAHVVLGMHFEEPEWRAGFEDLVVMGSLQPDAGPRGDGVGVRAPGCDV
jgi:hypothetical protein